MRPITSEAYKLFHDGSIALAQVEANGIRIDTDYLEQAISDTSIKINEIADGIKKYKIFKVWRKRYGSKINLDSREQLANVLFEDMKYTCYAHTKTGRPQADEVNLKSTGLEFVDKYLRLQKLKKARSTYLRNILQETVDGFLHPNFPLNLVSSYRGSSDHPSFQNIPIRDPEICELVRRAFISRVGSHLVEIDFKGAEICCATCYHKDPRMVKYIENPKLDMHRDMAAEIYKLKKRQVSHNTRYVGKNRFVFPEFYGDWWWSRATDLWRAIEELDLKIEGTDIDLYSHLESMGIYELGSCGTDEEPEDGTFQKHVREIEYDFWNKRFKIYNQWKKDWWEAYQEDGFFKMLTGFIVAGKLNRKQAINIPIQGSAFHWLLWCLIRIQKLMKKYKMRSMIVGQIHDSILADIHMGELKEYLKIVKQVIYEDLPKHWKWIIVPLTVEAEVAPVGGSWFEKEEIKI